MLKLLSRGAVISLVLLALGENARAVPAPPTPIQLTNDDGSGLWGHMFGDEHLSWLEDLEGYALAFDPALGAWCYAELGPDGRLRPTLVRAGSADPAFLGLPLHLRPSAEIRTQTRALRDARPVPQPPPSPGVVPNLVLLVKFSNQTTHFQPADFGPVFNGADGSVNDYWQAASLGRIDLVSTVTPWIPLPNTDLYYAYNDQVYGHPEQMIIHAVDYLDGQGFDFTPFDQNPQDGILDAVTVIHSGQGYETTGNQNYIHSHFADLRWYGLDFYTHDGIRVVAYHTEPEYRGDGVHITQIGVVAHESAHFFGLPDLYDYDGDSAGVGMWCLMAMGPWGGPGMDGTVPVLLSAWGKYKLGFVSPTVLQVSTAGLRLHPAATNPEALLLNTGMPTRQYFLLEDRQFVGYDESLPAEGLLIQHVDENIDNNNDQSHYLVDIEQADGLRELNNSGYEIGDWGDLWPNGNASTFGPDTSPNSRAYGQATSRITVMGITRDGEDIVFNVDLAGTAGSLLLLSPTQLAFAGAVGSPDPSALPVSVTHQGTSALSWTASPQQAWLRVSPASGGTPGVANVSVVTAGLGAGTHTGTVVFSAPGAANSANLTVRLSMDATPPAIAVDPASLGFRARAGASAIEGQPLAITNGGGGTLDWTASLDADASWASLSASSGRAPSTLLVTAHAGGLAAGLYPGTLTLTAAGAAPLEVPLELILDPQPHLAVSPAELVFEGVKGEVLPAPAALSVQNSAGGPMSFQASGSPGWVDVGAGSGAAPAQVMISLDVDYLATGEHLGSVTVSSAEADNGPIVVPVRFLNASPNTAPGAPTLLSPPDLASLSQVFPELTVSNASDPDGDRLTYEFEVVTYPDQRVVALDSGVAEGTSYTSHVLSSPLEIGGTYQWRARAADEHGLPGPWTERLTFGVSRGDSAGCASAGAGGLGGLGLLGLLGLAWLRARRC
ncbi:MAG TPA: M6 family metalloprotease domain-containing protein [Myxococcota bacterium]|nr:M6 family metalloprotease domain-containing protein [Myxococcota bacterium]HRY92451.1 M6 family metalloprotease domain-containing protein [Myxococcota bacterium]